MKMVVVKAIILDIQLTHHVVGGVPEAVIGGFCFSSRLSRPEVRIARGATPEDRGSNPRGA